MGLPEPRQAWLGATWCFGFQLEPLLVPEWIFSLGNKKHVFYSGFQLEPLLVSEWVFIFVSEWIFMLVSEWTFMLVSEWVFI